MRVVVHHHSYYDWEPVPPDVRVTPEDLASGHAKPDARGMGFLMRVTKKAPPEGTHTLVTVREDDIIHKMMHNLHPAQGRVTVTRREALAQLLVSQVMPNHAHPKHITDFEVEDDGPNEELFHQIVEPFLTIQRGGTNEMVLDEEDFDDLLDKYMETASPKEHVEHLHVKFGTKRKAGQ
jgi:hypothetical protein